MEKPMSKKLIVCQYKYTRLFIETVGRFYEDGTPVPDEVQAIREPHLRYVFDMMQKGVLWAGGPLADWTGAILIYSVDSLEEAKRAMENEPYYANGLGFDAQYFEWVLHVPVDMADAAHKEALERAFKSLGLL